MEPRLEMVNSILNFYFLIQGINGFKFSFWLYGYIFGYKVSGVMHDIFQTEKLRCDPQSVQPPCTFSSKSLAGLI